MAKQWIVPHFCDQIKFREPTSDDRNVFNYEESARKFIRDRADDLVTSAENALARAEIRRRKCFKKFIKLL